MPFYSEALRDKIEEVISLQVAHQLNAEGNGANWHDGQAQLQLLKASQREE